jgi:hypothetical protein
LRATVVNLRRHSPGFELTGVLGLVALLTCSTVSVAQKPIEKAARVAADTGSSSADEGTEGRTFLVGLAGSALSYDGGRDEQALGAVLRWAPVRWFSLSATPTTVRVREAVVGTLSTSSRGGLTDTPIEATIAHGFAASWSPSVAASLSVTLPTGDTASGLGSGTVGYATSGGVGFSPAEQVWVHLGAGRSLTRFSVQSAFSSGTGWGDASAGVNITDRVSMSAGYSSDLGAADSSLGRSTSIEGGASLGVGRAGTVNLTASRGLTGAAPRWSIALGVGTAFPYLNHLGGSSPSAMLQQSFGGGPHGLGNGNGNGGSSGTSNSGRGHSKKP